MEDMAMVVMDMAVATMERGRLRLKLSLDTSEEDMVDMAMVDTAVATMERGRLMLSLDTSEEDMVDMDMVVMAVATMERGRLMLNLDTSEEDMVDMDMVVMAVATTERGRLMLSLDISEEDMVDMAMAVMAMEEDIMVKCFNYLLAVSPLTNFSLAQHKKMQIKSEPFQTSFYFYYHRSHEIKFFEITLKDCFIKENIFNFVVLFVVMALLF